MTGVIRVPRPAGGVRQACLAWRVAAVSGIERGPADYKTANDCPGPSRGVLPRPECPGQQR